MPITSIRIMPAETGGGIGRPEDRLWRDSIKLSNGGNMKRPSDENSTFCFADPSDFQRFRRVLEEASYSDEGISKRLFVDGTTSIKLNDMARLLRRTNQGTPLDTLIRLFLIGTTVDMGAAREAFHGMEIGSLAEAGLLSVDGNTVGAKVKLHPVHIKLPPLQHLFLAHDHARRLRSPSKRDYVMGVASSTLALANVTVRRRIGAALDLCSGSGFHALLAARHSDRVTAVDLNPRAARLTAFNTRLNGIGNVESLEGDLFRPVEGRKFDLIVCNPPFVISPGEEYLYRDNKMQGDQLCRRIVREAANFLNDGGYFQMLCNWVEPPGEDWGENIRRWFDGTGCDAWVMRTQTRHAEAYASEWINHSEFQEAKDPNRLFDEWMAYLDAQGITAISYGLIAMRRSSGKANWFKADDGPEKLPGPCGDLIERGFRLKDYLGTVRDDSTLLGSLFVISPDARLEMRFRPSSGEWAEVESSLSLVRGISKPGSIDSFLAKVLIGCNGQNRLGDLVPVVADILESDGASVAPQLCSLVRRLVEQGFLLPAQFGV
jgi:SAM-dependent methyltransferase